MVKDLTLSKASRQFLRRTTGAALVALTAFCAFAEPDVYDETTGFVTCLTTKSAGFVMDPTTWSDGVPVHNDTNYYVGVGYSAKTGDYDATSKSATFAPSLYVAGQIGTSGQASNVMIFDDLRMLPGSTLYNSSIPTWKGKMTVLTPEGTDPVTLSHNRVGYAMKLALAVVGDANARIVMSGSTAGCSMTRSGDWSGFHGTFSVRDGYTVDDSGSVFSTPGTVAFGNGGVYNQHAKAMARFGNLTFGDNATANCRTVTVENVFCTGVDCLVKVSGGSSFGTFSVGAGTAIEFQGMEPTISIAEKLAFGAGVTIVYPSQLSSVLTEADPFLPMMRLSAACVAAGLPSLDDVGVRVSGLSVGDMPKDVALAYRDGEAGGKILGVTYARMIENLQGNIQQDCSLQNHATLHRFLGGDGETDCWSGGHYPQPTDDCYSVNSLGLCNSCVPPRTLVMGKGTLYVAGVCAACDIKMLDGSLVYCRYNGSATLNGSIGLYGGFRIFEAYQSATLTLNSDVYGEGSFDFRAYYPSGTSVAKFRLFGDNSRWSGKMKFSYNVQSGETFIEDEKNHVKVYVDNSNALGGGTAELAYDAIQLNRYGEIIVMDNAAFTNDCRGVYVNGNGAITVEADKTVSFAAPVTMNGTLRKGGDGRLVLGAPLRFLVGGASDVTPASETSYPILVQAGELAVSDADALNGATVTFGSGTALSVQADATGDLKKFGARFDKVSAPFTTPVAVRIDAADPAALSGESLSVALLTVKAADADAVNLSVTCGFKGYRLMSVLPVPVADADAVTFVAKVERPGMVLILR